MKMVKERKRGKKRRRWKMYKCGMCGRELTDSASAIRCPYCGYRIIYKSRPLVAKKVIAR